MAKILVVEDEAGIREVLSDALHIAGFDTTIAPDGFDAIKRLRDETFDLIIADINMPRMDGYEMLERMRERDLDGRADVVAHFLDEVEAGDDLSELRHHLDDVLIGDGQLRIWLIADSGAVVYGGKTRPATQPADPNAAVGKLTIWREDGGNAWLRRFFQVLRECPEAPENTRSAVTASQ